MSGLNKRVDIILEKLKQMHRRYHFSVAESEAQFKQIEERAKLAAEDIFVVVSLT